MIGVLAITEAAITEHLSEAEEVVAPVIASIATFQSGGGSGGYRRISHAPRRGLNDMTRRFVRGYITELHDSSEREKERIASMRKRLWEMFIRGQISRADYDQYMVKLKDEEAEMAL